MKSAKWILDVEDRIVCWEIQHLKHRKNRFFIWISTFLSRLFYIHFILLSFAGYFFHYPFHHPLNFISILSYIAQSKTKPISVTIKSKWVSCSLSPRHPFTFDTGFIRYRFAYGFTRYWPSHYLSVRQFFYPAPFPISSIQHRFRQVFFLSLLNIKNLAKETD